jgi:hypothetical protein
MIGNEGQVSRPPSVAELEFLTYLRKRDGYEVVSGRRCQV